MKRSALTHKLTERECEVCRKAFLPAKLFQVVCGHKCATKLPSLQRKRIRAQDRAQREAMKTRQDWAKEAEAVVNRYVRWRDRLQPCVSCDRPAAWGGQWHASHFRSVKAASALRFNLWNMHKACSVCNNHKSGNLSEYEPRLRAKIGDAKVDWLRTQNQIVRYEVEYLRRLRDVFKRKAKRLEQRQ